MKPDQIIEVSETVKDCVKEAELIVTVTFSHEPVMKARDDLKKTDCHIMAVGAPRQRFVPSIWNIEKDVFGQNELVLAVLNIFFKQAKLCYI